jgi:hypothetical protein
MHPTTKIGSFMTLRANGWSLDKIAKKINVSKSTLWAWDVKHQNEIHLLKHMQLERVQEQYLPSYEEELKSVSNQLARVDQALAEHNLAAMGPAFLMQMSLQLRDRLSKMRQQAPLRTVQYGPIEPLPVTGCVTKDDDYPWVAGDPAIEAAEDAAEAAEATGAAEPALAQSNTPPSRSEPSATPGSKNPRANGAPHLNGHSNGNGKPHLNGHSDGHRASKADRIVPAAGVPDASALLTRESTLEPSRQNQSPPCLRVSVVPSENKTEQNRTKREGGQNSGPSPSTTCNDEN